MPSGAMASVGTVPAGVAWIGRRAGAGASEAASAQPMAPASAAGAAAWPWRLAGVGAPLRAAASGAGCADASEAAASSCLASASAGAASQGSAARAARPTRRPGPSRGAFPVSAASRRAQVGLGARAAWLLFGSPSMRRANGGAEASLVPAGLRGERWRARRAATPVFAVDRRGRGAAERLPRVWVSEPAFDARTGARVGRELVGSYPNDRDHGGTAARALADAYFGEALALSASEDAALRVECFRAAELLYLHAAERGNAGAWVRLGVIYRDDLGQGRYWQTRLEERALHTAPRPLAARAASCFRRGAEAGDAEACWALGDLVADGVGQVADPERGLAWYRRALVAAERAGDDAALGNAALRLARALEGARGCAHSFEEALAWYERASEALARAEEAGGWFFKRPLREARVGVRRMAQEIHGGY